MRLGFSVLAVIVCTMAGLPTPASAQLAYPSGRSQQKIEGLETTLHLPEGEPEGKSWSLVVLLHGSGGLAARLSTVLAAWPAEGYVVCAPQSVDKRWDTAEVKQAERIALHLLDKLPIDRDKVHVMGFSNGGFNLGPLAFSDELKPVSATFVGSGIGPGGVPKWARERLGVLASCGADDPYAGRAATMPKGFEGKVRNCEAKFQKGLGHRWPRDHNPYMLWFMGVMEGRFRPGDDMSFDWQTDLAAARASQVDAKRGGSWAYLFDSKAEKQDDTKRLQGWGFFDPELRFLGRQVPAVKLDLATVSLPPEIKVKKVPAIVVFDKKGKLKKTLQGKIKARSVIKALKKIAPRKRRD